MKFTLDSKEMFSHLVLTNSDYATALASTEEWKENGEFTAKVLINGIECPAQALNVLLEHMWKLANDESGQSDFDLKVKEAAEKLLQEKANVLYETINELSNKLDDVTRLLPYNWEK